MTPFLIAIVLITGVASVRLDGETHLTSRVQAGEPRPAGSPADGREGDDPPPAHAGDRREASAPLAPCQRDRRFVTLAAGVFLEAWNYNLSHEGLYAGSIGLGRCFADGWSINVESTVAHVRQGGGRDALLSGVSAVVRFHPYTRGRLALYVETGGGATNATERVPPRGTRFNFLFQAGGGATFQIAPGWQVMGGLRWVHLSNNGHEGRDRNPDLQAIGGRLGVALAF